MSARRAALFALLALAQCARPRTEILVVVDTDLSWRGAMRDLTHVELTVRSGSRDGPERFSRVIDLGHPVPLPLSFGVSPIDGDASRLVWVRVRGCQNAECAPAHVVERRALTGFVEGQTLRLDMFLAAECVNVTCMNPLLSCRPNRGCVPETDTAGTVSVFDPGAPLGIDGGARRDAPAAADIVDASDGGTSPDAPIALRDSGIDASDVVDVTDAHDAVAVVDVTDVTDAPLVAPLRRLAVGSRHACVIRGSDQRLVCWGLNGRCQLGTGTDGGRPCPELPAPALLPTSDRWIEVAAGSSFTCGLRADHSVACWGGGTEGLTQTYVLGADLPDTPTPQTIAGLPRVEHIAAGDFHACALDAAGRVWCWGDNRLGQIPGATGSGVATPTRFFTAGPTAYHLAAGGSNGCLISTSGEGTVFCWGRNEHAQAAVADGGFVVSMPTAVARPTPGFSVVEVGAMHTCALQQGSGDVWCWGYNRALSAGVADGGVDVRTPTLRVMGANASALAVGGPHTCFVQAASPAVVRCFGSRAFGESGVGVMLTPADVPDRFSVPGVSVIDEIAAGENHTCVRAGEQVWCWGEDSVGQSSGAAPLDGGLPDGAVRVDAPGIAQNPIARPAPVRVPLPG